MGGRAGQGAEHPYLVALSCQSQRTTTFCRLDRNPALIRRGVCHVRPRDAPDCPDAQGCRSEEVTPPLLTFILSSFYGHNQKSVNRDPTSLERRELLPES